MLVGSILTSSILVLIFSLEVTFFSANFNIATLILPIIVISIVATVVEALSPKGTDNLTIFLAIVIFIYILEFGFPEFWPFPFAF